MDTIRLVLELLYFASGPAIALFALLGLRQLTISKQNSVVSAKRESYRLAAEQCTLFLDHIIPLINDLDVLITEKSCDFITKAKVDIQDDHFSIVIPTEPIDSITDDFKAVILKALEVANCMEGLAMFFTSGVAAEGVAYSSIGETFTRQVRKLLPVIHVGVKGGKHFQNLIKLFFLWNNRLKSENLLSDKSSIEKRLAKITGQKITPLGVDGK